MLIANLSPRRARRAAGFCTKSDDSMKTRCFMGWSSTRLSGTGRPSAEHVCSDGYAGYRQVNYRYLVGRGKSSVSCSQLARRTRGFAKSDAGLLTLREFGFIRAFCLLARAKTRRYLRRLASIDYYKTIENSAMEYACLEYW